MAFVESDRVKIRAYLGAGAVLQQLFPKLENAITAVQSTADGGTQTDSSTENYILSIITKLETLETKIEALHCQVQVMEANQKEVVLDAARGLYALKQEGRRYIGILSRTLSCAPLYDYFSGQVPSASDFADIGTPIL